MAAFQRLLDRHRLNVLLYACRTYASITGNSAEVEAAARQPGILLRAPTTANRRGDTYLPVEAPA